MEPNLSSRKRNQSSSSSSFNNPFEGIYTRSKSQIYLHHSRSGRSRSDVIRKRNHTQLYDAPPRRRSLPSPDQQEEEAVQLESISHISIKDLRARRVFSPSSMIGDEEDCFDNGGVSKLDYGCKIVNDISPNLCSMSEDCCDKDVVVEEIDEDSEKAMLVVEGLCDVNSKGNGGVVNLSGDFDQMKPLEVDEIRGFGSKNGGISSASVCKKDIDSSNVSVSRSKLVKVFKTPSSFNYRRLLPFLMDISKDDSCIQKIEIVDVGFPCKIQKLNHMSPNLSSVTVDDQCTSKKDDNGAHSEDRKPSEYGGTEGRSMNGINPNSSQVEGTIELHNVEQRRNEVGENTADMMEQCYQMTPPDADIFSKPDEGDNTKDKEDNVLQNEDAVLDKPLNGSVNRNIGNYHPDCDQRKGFNSKSKLVLNPCSRVKVFKAPNSVSYRRLLPYLMDVAKENPCSSIISQGTKDVKDMDQMQHPVTSPSSHLDAHMDKSVADSNSEEQHCTADEEPKLPTPTLTPLPTSALPMDDSSNEPNLTDGSSNLKGPNLVSSKNITKLQMPLDLQVEKSSELEHVLSESPSELEPETNNDVATNAASYTEASSGSNVNLENFPRESVLDVSQSTSVERKGDLVQQMDNENEGKPITGSLDQNSSQTEALTSSGIQVGSIRKGILRRNPRGCRGLCKCLNCASFHLHAERAFEFSRNQMQDAEEVASELMNELGYLRNILNETAVNPRVVQVHQVKEACSKALKAEELAKKRLGEMNEYLNFHCRNACLQQPRVTFSNNVEQKFIPKAGLTWK